MESVSIYDLANHDHHDYDFDTRADMVSYVQELSKKTLGSYVKKSSVDAQGAAAALGVSTGKKGGQTRDDVHKNVGKMLKRQKGIEKATDKLSKEEKVDEELPVGHREPSPGSDSTDSYAKMQDAKRKAKAAGDKEDNWQKYHENINVIDAVKEVLGLGNKWPGIEKMPPVDPKTGKYVTGKSKIERLPDKKPKKQK